MKFFTLVVMILSALLGAFHYYQALGKVPEGSSLKTHLRGLILHTIAVTTLGWLILGGL